jgi:F-type H+-transporting ATPase subunit delta
VPRGASGQRYAQAIFELAVAQGQLEPWADQLAFAGQVVQDDEFRAFLGHAEVPLERKTAAVDAVLQDVDPLVKNLVSLLVSRGAVRVLGDVHEAYVTLLDAHLGRQRVEVTSAVPLDDQELQRITQFVAGLTNKEIVVSARVDEAILGGIIIQIGDQLLDGSTRARLEELRKQIRSETVRQAP